VDDGLGTSDLPSVLRRTQNSGMIQVDSFSMIQRN